MGKCGKELRKESFTNKMSEYILVFIIGYYIGVKIYEFLLEK